MITRVLIEHYKSIQHLDMQMGRLMVLAGPNASGKSNFVDALRFLRDAVAWGLDRAVGERHGFDSIRQWSPRKPYLVTIRVDVQSINSIGHFSVTLASNRGNYLVRREEASWVSRDFGQPTKLAYERDHDGGVIITVGEVRSAPLLAEQPEELFLLQAEARHFRPLLRALSSFEAYSIFPNVLRSPQRSSSEHRLLSSGENLTSIFRSLTKSKSQRFVSLRTEILTAMQKVMPQLDSIRIQALGGLTLPVFRVREPAVNIHDFNVSQVSDGTLRVLGLLTALYQPFRPEVLAMEEPEQTVNPGILALLADAIRDVSKSSQVLVTTHSPELIDKFGDPDVVFAAEMHHGVTTIAPVAPDQKQAVKDRLFSLGELMSIEGLHP